MFEVNECSSDGGLHSLNLLGDVLLEGSAGTVLDQTYRVVYHGVAVSTHRHLQLAGIDFSHFLLAWPVVLQM